MYVCSHQHTDLGIVLCASSRQHPFHAYPFGSNQTLHFVAICHFLDCVSNQDCFNLRAMPKIVTPTKNKVTPTRVKSPVSGKGRQSGTSTKVRDPKKQRVKKKTKKQRNSNVIALAKVVSCDDLGFDIRAELNVHENGNGTFSVNRPLKPNSVYEVELDYAVLDDDGNSSDIDEWVHGRIVKASFRGPAKCFRGIKEYNEMLCDPLDETGDDSGNPLDHDESGEHT